MTTDAQGRFTFPTLAGGQYSVRVARDGYLLGGTGQQRPGGSVGQMRLADGEQASLTIRLLRGGAITGHVYDEYGEPVQRARVQAQRLTMRNGVRQLQNAAVLQTDDRGAYRFFGLQPGEYLVSAQPPARPAQQSALDTTAGDMAAIAAAMAEGRVQPGVVPGYHPAYVAVPAPTPAAAASAGAGPVLTVQPASVVQFVPIFAPGTPDRATAAIVRVAAGADHGPYDIVLQAITATLVRVITPALPGGVSLQAALSPLDPTMGDTLQAMRMGTEATSALQFQNVPPGTYHLLAQTVAVRTAPASAVVSGRVADAPATQPPPAEVPTLWAREEITVSGEPEIEVRVSLQSPRTLSGRVVFDTPQRPVSSALRVTLGPAPGPTRLPVSGMLQAPIDADGRFTIAGVVPGRYVLRAAVAGGLLRSSIVDGQDTLDVPIEITGERDITGAVVTVTSLDRQTTLWGRIGDRSDEPLSNVAVVVAATDERYWVPGGRRVVMTRTDGWGDYRVSGLPPGTYTVASAHDLEPGEQYDPDLLRSIAALGARVRLQEGETTRQDFRSR